MTKFYKNHKSEKTAKLHEAFDTMTREAALDFAIGRLGYTKAGAASWFSHWAKMDTKTEAKAAPAKPKKETTFDKATKAMTAKRKPAAESKAKAAAKKKPAKAKAAPAKAEAKEAVPA